MSYLRSLSVMILRKLGSLLPSTRLEWIVKRLLEGKIAALSEREALAVMLRLHNHIEHNAGLLSVAYGKGIHSKHRHTRYHDFFVARITPDSSVIDIGCGNGMMSHAIATRCGAKVLAIDLDPENIARAKLQFPHNQIEYRVCDVLKEPPTGSCDVIVLSNVLEHLPGRASFLRRLAESFRPVKFLIRVPLFERDWIVPLKQELGIEWRSDPTHETEYSQESFRQEMGEAGLCMTEVETRWGEIWAEAVPCKPTSI